MKKKVATGFFGIYKGRQVGVFTTWDETKSMINGYSGAIYKKFATKEEADIFATHGLCAPASSISSGISSSVLNASTSSFVAEPILKPTKKRKQQSQNTVVVFDKKEEKTIEVYTDGSCHSLGTKDVLAGYGIYYGCDDARNEYGPIPNPPFTSQRGELYAVLRVLQSFDAYIRSLLTNNSSTNKTFIPTLVINSDSSYSIRSSRDYVKRWMKCGWKTTKNEDVANQDIIRPIASLLYENDIDLNTNVQWRWIPAHKGIKGNEHADALAKLGSQLSESKKKKKKEVSS